jgi:hypothetical protein
MDEVQTKRMVKEISPPEKAARTQLETSERIIRLLIMAAFISVLAFEAWLLAQVFQLF